MIKAELYRQNHSQKHTHTDSQEVKNGKKKYIYIYISFLPMSTSSIWCDSLSIQVFHRCRVHQVDCRDLICCSWCCWERFPFLFFVCTATGLQLLSVGNLRAFILRSDRMVLKEQLIQGLWLTQARGGRGMECGVSLWRQRPAWCCNSLRYAVCSPGEVVPEAQDPGSGGLHRLPGGEV